MQLKKIILIFLSIIILTGCSNNLENSYTDIQKNSSNNNESNNTTSEITNSTSDNITNDQTTSSNINSSENNESDTVSTENTNNNTTSNEPIEQNNEIEYTDNDMKVINEFNDIENNINNLLNSPTSEDIKTKAKGTFISIVDFIFYDGTINGITFDELSDAGKEKILNIANDIDNKITTKYPDYKETISDKTKAAFLKASELIKIGANNINNFSKDKLGEDNYNTLLESKDNLVYYTKNAFSIIGEIGSNIFETSKNYLKNWYEQFKNN